MPSRLHPGKFYALPQAPQQFKQLIMVAGFDRYFQIAPCFRDEDGRADRSPGEFYQLDIEMSFVTQDDVFAAIEPVLHGVFEEFADGRKVSPAPFPRIPYSEAMLHYGSDKPDLAQSDRDRRREGRFSIARTSSFKAFKNKEAVRAIPAPGAGAQPRSWFDKLNDWARSEGAPGLGYIVFEDEGGKLVGKGPIAKFLSPKRSSSWSSRDGEQGRRRGVLRRRQGGARGDARGPGAHQASAMTLSLIAEGPLRVLLDRRFPDVRVERGREEDRLLAQSVLDAAIATARFCARDQGPRTILGIKAFQYDIVCNGVELSLRRDPQSQARRRC